LRRYILEAANGWSNDGLLLRFQLLVQADLPEYRRVVRPDTGISQRYETLLHNLWHLARHGLNFPTTLEVRPGITRPLATFDPEAQALYLDWLEQTARESRQPTTPSLKRSLLEKQAGLVPKLALLLELVEHLGASKHIGKINTARAIALANLYKAHSLKVWGAAIQPEAEGAALLAERIEKRTRTKTFNFERFTVRDIQRCNWRGLSNPRVIQGALAELEALGWVARTGDTWTPNPRIWEK
jgi:hypothetical protein